MLTVSGKTPELPVKANRESSSTLYLSNTESFVHGGRSAFTFCKTQLHFCKVSYAAVKISHTSVKTKTKQKNKSTIDPSVKLAILL